MVIWSSDCLSHNWFYFIISNTHRPIERCIKQVHKQTVQIIHQQWTPPAACARVTQSGSLVIARMWRNAEHWRLLISRFAQTGVIFNWSKLVIYDFSHVCQAMKVSFMPLRFKDIKERRFIRISGNDRLMNHPESSDISVSDRVARLLTSAERNKAHITSVIYSWTQSDQLTAHRDAFTTLTVCNAADINTVAHANTELTVRTSIKCYC